MNKLAIKWTIILAALFGAVALLWPSYEWYSKTPQERESSKPAATGQREYLILVLI